MKVFLTGSTGFIGQALTKALLARGWSVRALVRKPDSPHALAIGRMGAEMNAGDITDRKSMRASMTGADAVVHCAGHYEFGLDKKGAQRMYSINVTGTDNVLGLALELGVPRTVYVSTVAALGDTGKLMRDETFVRQYPCCTVYEQLKTDAHDIALNYQQRGLPLIIVCPHAVIGANDHSPWGYFLRMYLNRVLPPVAWSPDAIHSLVYRDDLVAGIARAAEFGCIGATYLLCGEAHSFREHLNFWTQRPGGFKPLVWLPAKVAAACFTPLEPLQRMLGLPAFMSRETVRTASMGMYYSSEKAKRELGWSHCSAEAMWLATIDAELEMLSRRKGQNLVTRLKPLDIFAVFPGTQY